MYLVQLYNLLGTSSLLEDVPLMGFMYLVQLYNLLSTSSLSEDVPLVEFTYLVQLYYLLGTSSLSEDVPLVEFMLCTLCSCIIFRYILSLRRCTSGGIYEPCTVVLFTCMPGDGYCRQPRSLLLCWFEVFWAQINSLGLVCGFSKLCEFSWWWWLLIQCYSPLSSRLTALACDSIGVTSFM